MKKEQKTKQGLRNLDALPSKSNGRTLEMPPAHQLCRHKGRKPDHVTGLVTCPECGTCWDYWGDEVT